MTTTRVRIVAVSHVRPSSTPVPDRVKLSLFDTPWVSYPPTQRLLVFHGASLPPFPELIESLKASLSQTLSAYYPLAGKLAYVPSSGDVEIDCSTESVGVAFIQAEAVDLDVQRLATDEVLDMDAFLQLVPELDAGELPAPVFAVQVTKFGNEEGVVVGIAAHHVVADGRAIWRFVEAWAAACRAEGGPSPPTVDRTVIRHPKGEEIARRSLNWVAPNLPKVEDTKKPLEIRLRLTRRTFVISPKDIQLLKQTAIKSAKDLEATKPPSTFVVVASQAWIALVRSKGLQLDEVTYLLIPADCRARIDPPVDEGYFGNCIIALFVKATVGDLMGEDGQGRACAAIQKVIRESLDQDPLKGDWDWMKAFKGVDMSKAAHVAGSPRFKVYEMDFGWGRPSRGELVSINEDGQFSFACARDGAGVQLTVALDPDHMEAFAKYFVDGLSE